MIDGGYCVESATWFMILVIIGQEDNQRVAYKALKQLTSGCRALAVYGKPVFPPAYWLPLLIGLKVYI